MPEGGFGLLGAVQGEGALACREVLGAGREGGEGLVGGCSLCVCVCACARAYVCVCVRVRMRACMHVRQVCVCVRLC